MWCIEVELICYVCHQYGVRGIDSVIICPAVMFVPAPCAPASRVRGLVDDVRCARYRAIGKIAYAIRVCVYKCECSECETCAKNVRDRRSHGIRCIRIAKPTKHTDTRTALYTCSNIIRSYYKLTTFHIWSSLSTR